MELRRQIKNAAGPLPCLPSEETYDLLWGVEAIAQAIGRTKRQTYHLSACGQLPVKKVGGRYVASRARLIEFLTSMAAA